MCTVDSRTPTGNVPNTPKGNSSNPANNDDVRGDMHQKGSRSFNLRPYDISESLGLVRTNDKRYEKGRVIKILNEDGSLWYEMKPELENQTVFESDELDPFRFNKDDAFLVMNCVGEDHRYYHVIVNEETKLKKYVKKDDPVFLLDTWQNYILDCFAVDFDQSTNPLLDAPDGSPFSIALGGELTFRPEEIQGDWLKLQIEQGPERQSVEGSAWVRWRSDGMMILQLFEIA